MGKSDVDGLMTADHWIMTCGVRVSSIKTATAAIGSEQGHEEQRYKRTAGV